MNTRELGNSGLEVSAIGYGAMNSPFTARSTQRSCSHSSAGEEENIRDDEK